MHPELVYLLAFMQLLMIRKVKEIKPLNWQIIAAKHFMKHHSLSLRVHTETACGYGRDNLIPQICEGSVPRIKVRRQGDNQHG